MQIFVNYQASVNKTAFKNKVKGLESELLQMKDNEKRMADEIEQLKKKLYP